LKCPIIKENVEHCDFLMETSTGKVWSFLKSSEEALICIGCILSTKKDWKEKQRLIRKIIRKGLKAEKRRKDKNLLLKEEVIR